ncbi:hypothetical protein DFJ73DRAFT_332906 [Zopfochytrium polystomum]|nr:hypothetical protein DFJ73DRAFT_332906 [Zopfochytrium polystomum]
MYTMWSVVDQRQQVEESVRAVLSDLKVAASAAGSRFTLRVFVERCKSLQLGWHSGQEFDLRVFLEKLTALDGEVSFASLVAVFKACGINTTVEEYKLLIGSIAGESYEAGLEVFKKFVPFIRQWGVEWNMWIVWSLLDEKEENEETMLQFLSQVSKFGPSAKFDLLDFVERCESLQSSWHANTFNIQVFVGRLSSIEGEVTFEKLTDVFNASGIRTASEEYRQLISALGGDFHNGMAVFQEWVKLIRLWGAEWFLRTSSTFFEKYEESKEAIEEYEKLLANRDQRPDLRSFVWACEAHNPAFEFSIFLVSLVSFKGELDEAALRNILIENGIDAPEDSYVALVGLLCGGGDSASSLSNVMEWVEVIRRCGVQFYVYVMAMRWRWDASGVDKRVALNAFLARIQFRYSVSVFDISKFVRAARKIKAGWNIRSFISDLVLIRGQFTVDKAVDLFKATGLFLSPDAAKDLLFELCGNRENGVAVLEEWAGVLRFITIDEALEGVVIDDPPQIVEPKKESWFTRAVRAVGEGAQAVGSTALQAG